MQIEEYQDKQNLVLSSQNTSNDKQTLMPEMIITSNLTTLNLDGDNSSSDGPPLPAGNNYI